MKWILKLVLLTILIPPSSMAQNLDDVLTKDKFLWLVYSYHPLSVQSRLLLDIGESTVLRSRGNFDPYVFSTYDRKEFKGKDYYSIFNGGLKVPTWYGVELKTSYDQNNGVFLNPEQSVPVNGLWNAGLSVTLGQGLFIDKRRATLKQAKLFAEASFFERQKMMNDLYFDAIKQYWKWFEAYNQYNIYNQSVGLAEERFRAVKQSFKFGDKPAIDTLEAFIQVQNRQLMRNQLLLNYQNITADLSNYLWFENNTPLVVTDSLRPPILDTLTLSNSVALDSFYTMLQQLPNTHPDLQLYENKLASLSIDRRLKSEMLKPTLNVEYNVLNEPIGNDVLAGISGQNNKIGVDFSFPIFLRKQRGDLQLADLKISNTTLEQQQKSLEVTNKVKRYYNEHITLQSQVGLVSQTVVNTNRLLIAERQKFNSGESSLFLINSREVYLINTQIKFAELVSKYEISRAGFYWSSGVLFTE